MLRGKFRSVVLGSASFTALLIGAGAQPAYAITPCVTATFDNTASITGVCVTTSFTGNITNEGTISPNGILFTAGTITGFIGSSGTIAGGITLDGASKIIGGGPTAAISLSGPTFTGGIHNAGTISNPTGSAVSITSTGFAGGVTNSGTIVAASSGIYAGKVSTFSGGITNAGTISANSNGISVQSNGTFTSGITNTGNISAYTGIGVGSNGTFAGGISNSGTISAVGIGVSVNLNGTFSGGITNAGTGVIIAHYSAISVGGSTFSGGISNAGTITTPGIAVFVGVGNFADGITNSGLIKSAGTAIDVKKYSTFAGGISNSGTISSSLNIGINVNSGSNFSGGITNAAAGTITAQKTAVFVGGSTFTGGISNAGTINSIVNYGLLINAGNFAGGITNSGKITAAVIAIDVLGSTFAGGITNSGTISNANKLGVEILNKSFAGGFVNAAGGKIVAASTAVNLQTKTFTGGISNAGLISSSGSGGLYVSAVTFGGNIINVGTIAGKTTALSVNTNTFSGGITNSGTLSGSTGLVVSLDAGTGIVNTGTITGTGGTGIDVTGVTTAAVINQNGGTVTGDVKLSALADVLTINGGTIAGNITGSGSLDTLTFNTGANTTYTLDTNKFTGINQANINSGTVVINSSINVATATLVASGATLKGTGGLAAALTVASGGTFAPGAAAGTPGTTMTVYGSLALQSGALYMVQLNGSTSTLATVNGTATLAGSVTATFASGSYGKKEYDILHTAGGRTGTFASLNVVNAPGGYVETLRYTDTDVYLDIAPPPLIPVAGLNRNQTNVANALNAFFTAGGTLPAGFQIIFGLTGVPLQTALSQASGPVATGSQQSTFNAQTMFMGLMTDPFTAGRDPGMMPATGYADEEANSYAATKKNSGAYAMWGKAKAPPMAPVGVWSVWAAGYGGSQSTSGNAAVGSGNTTSSIYGTAVGADYRISANTLAGFALAGGGTSFSVAGAGNGSGRSDLFQAGGFVRHSMGPAYITAALAYGWQDVTTDRTVTIAGIDQLRARFNANAFSGRLEGGYRYVISNAVGLTPYAAAQFTTFDLPTYTEGVKSGANTFALTYGAKDVTDPRTELGLRSDKSFAVANGILTLRGRAAWAYDYTTDRSIGATFQALPTVSFVTNGAAQAHNSALTTASAEMKWMNGWSASATFEGEFSNVTKSYAGKGALRYSW